MTRPRGQALTALLAAAAVVLPAAPASGDGFGGRKGPPATASGPQRGTAQPAGGSGTCRVYGSSSGFGLLCSDATAGRTLEQVLRSAGIDTSRPFCWDDPDLPDGFEPDRAAPGPGRWWLHTCLSFDGAVVRANARLTYEFVFRAPGAEDVLTGPRVAAIARVTGRGQIPFLQAQASPLSSPRVGQDVAFSLLCDGDVLCADGPGGRTIRTPALRVAGVQMWAELVHLRVLPEGGAAPSRAVDCTGGGLPQTAEELDRGAVDDARVCRHRYDRSSDDAGGGTSGDRYPARVTAYWQIRYDDGSGPRDLGLPYEKSTVNQIRVTEVQTLVVG